MVALTIDTQRLDEILVVALAGELDIYTVHQFLDVVAGIRDERRIVVDVSAVDLIDSSGLSALLRTSEPWDGSTPSILISREGNILRLLELAHLRGRFVVVPDVAAARVLAADHIVMRGPGSRPPSDAGS